MLQHTVLSQAWAQEPRGVLVDQHRLAWNKDDDDEDDDEEDDDEDNDDE